MPKTSKTPKTPKKPKAPKTSVKASPQTPKKSQAPQAPKSPKSPKATTPSNKSVKASPKAPKAPKAAKASTPKAPRKTRRWLIFGWVLIGIGIAIASYVGRHWLRQGLRWTERRYFAHIGDKGPLQRTDAGQWQAHHPGLWSRTILFKRKHHWSRVRLRLMRVDLAQHKLSLWWQRKPRTIHWIMKHTKAIAAINGGLFDPKYRPLGFYQSNGRVLNPRMHKRTIDGVVFVRGGKLQVAAAKGWQRAGATLAFQSAPLLVAHGKRIPLSRKSWKVDRRSALCLNAEGQLILMATDGFINGLSFFELGLLMAAPSARGGLGCLWGINLDGGSSSQWAVRSPQDRAILSTSGIPVPLFLLLTPRHPKAP